jgi:hypothetical protein
MAESDMMRQLLAFVTGSSSKCQINWSAIGHSEEERDRRLKQLFEALEECSALFEARQEAELEAKQAEVGDMRADIAAMQERLGDEGGAFEGSGDDLLALERSLAPKLAELKAAEAERLRVLTGLKERIYDASTRLGAEVPVQFASLDGPLSAAREQAFAEHVHVLEKEQQNRRADLQKALADCASLLQELEIAAADGATDVDRAAMGDGAALEGLGLSMAAIATVSARCSDLQKERATREQKLQALGAEITEMWELLGVEKDVRSAFHETTTGLGLAAVAACEAECAKLTVLKQEKLGEIIADVRHKITATWDVLKYSEGQRAAFAATMGATEHDDASLEAHQAELSRLAAIVEEQAPILKMIGKYETTVAERAAADAAEADKSRLLGKKAAPGFKAPREKGAHLRLKEEERMRTRVKALPKLTAALNKALVKWAEEHGPMLSNGVEYLAKMEAEEAAYETAKKEALEAKKAAKKASLAGAKTFDSPKKAPRKPVLKRKPRIASSENTAANGSKKARVGAA